MIILLKSRRKRALPPRTTAANRLNFEPDKHDWYFPSSHHYQLQSEFPLGMTAEQFYNALQEEPVESVLNGTPLKN